MSNQIIKTSTDLNLSGKINGNVVNLLVLCDAAKNEINVTLPDSKNVKIASVVIVKTDTTENTVNVSCGLSGQKISNVDIKEVNREFDALTLYPYDSGYIGMYAKVFYDAFTY